MAIDKDWKDKSIKARKAIERYRKAHGNLHRQKYYRGIHADHTPLLKTLIANLEKIGFTTTETDFEPKKEKLLKTAFDDSELLNIKELGFEDRIDFEKRATKANREALREKWH